MKERYIWALLRLSMAFIFLWAFFDKLLGLGFATKSDQAWILGNSPTYGFLKFGTHGPFAEFFQSLAGNLFVDWLFMLGLLLIGVALLLGIGVRIAGYSGFLLLFLMWLSLLPPENNPILDDHVIYALVMIGLVISNSGEVLGFGRSWNKSNIVKNYPILK